MSATETTTPKAIEEAMKQALAQAREKIENCDLPEHYNQAIDYLDENFAFFLTHVLNIGRPVWFTPIKTAAVGMPKGANKKDDFVYLFNPIFAALLEPEEFAFIMAHETMHVLLNHLTLLKKGQTNGKFKDREKFNIAADCVINDYLVSMGLQAGKVRDFGMFGPDVVGYDCSNSTVSEVYKDLPENAGKGKGDGDGEGDGEGSSLGDYLGDSPGDVTGDHGWMDDTKDGQEDAAEELSKDAKDGPGLPQDLEDKKLDDENQGTPGSGAGDQDGGLRKFVEEKGVSLKWAELLREINPDMFPMRGPYPRPSYHRPRRKMMGVMEHYTDMGNLPVVREPDDPKGETPSIVMFMDGSGSCSHYIDRFVTLARSVPPEKIKLMPYTFSTYVIALDLENPRMASGGTAFSPIEQTIQSEIVPELGHYPKAVVILTDGEGSFSSVRPPEQYKDRWLWMLTDGGRRSYGGLPGREQDIDKFCEGMKSVKPPTRSYW